MEDLNMDKFKIKYIEKYDIIKIINLKKQKGE